MKTKLFSISFTILLLSSIINKTSCQDRLSVAYANQFSISYIRVYGCQYCKSVLFNAFEHLYLLTGDSGYYNMVETYTDLGVSDYGGCFAMSAWSVDEIPLKRHTLTMYQLTGDEKYSMCADIVLDSIQNAPRTSYGGFWHKSYYPNEMWLDGIYMASPFYVQYNKMFNKPELFDDVAHQVTEMYVHSWDSLTKLPCHGWYDANNDPSASPPYWADSETGKSPVFWGRSIGWYAMAIVNILDYLPKNHSMKDSIIGIFNNLAEGIASYQDPDSHVWWQVVDQAERDSNWIESSASCMFVYALAKGVRMGYIDSTYLQTAITGYQGILNKFVDTISNYITISNICEGTSVGPDYTFYAERSRYSSSRYVSHVDGAFILASIEMEMLDSIYPPGLLAYDSVTDGAIHISWLNNQQNILGFILERKTDGDFTIIAELGVDTVYYADSLIEPNTNYIYRVRAYTENDTSRWSNYLKVISANEGGLPSQAFLPSPKDSATNIELDYIQYAGLRWRKGLLADYHKLYFGTTNPPPFVADVYNISYFPENVCSDSMYYWRIDEVNDKGTTTGETWIFTMNNVVPVETLHTSKSIHIFPNPGSEKIHIEGLLQNSVILVYDLRGILCYSHVAEKEKLEIDIHNLQKGMYIVQVRGSEGIMYKKLIKE